MQIPTTTVELRTSGPSWVGTPDKPLISYQVIRGGGGGGGIKNNTGSLNLF